MFGDHMQSSTKTTAEPPWLPIVSAPQSDASPIVPEPKIVKTFNLYPKIVNTFSLFPKIVKTFSLFPKILKTLNL